MTINPFSILIMKCALASDKSINEESNYRDLETYFSAWALASCPPHFYPDGNDHTGFVSTSVNEKTVHLPIHLAPLFPLSTVEENVRLAENVRVMTDSTICLSGSQVFGVNSTVDTDFCEYVCHTGKRLAGSFLRLNKNRSSICASVRHGKSGNALVGRDNVLHGIMDLCSTDSGVIGAECTCNPRTWKFDYYCHDSDLEAAVTNLCVHEQDCEEYSYAFQEAVITELGQPVRHLTDPVQLGKYVLWLRAKIQEYKDEFPLKALKRALSLCRILCLDGVSEKVLILLNSKSAEKIARENSSQEIIRLENLLEIPSRTVGERAPGEDADDQMLNTFRSDTNATLDSVIQQYEELFQRAQNLIGSEHARTART